MLDIIVNPLAGGKKGKVMKKNLAAAEARLTERKIPYRLHFTQYEKHAITLTSELIDAGATDIIAMGGDGTLNEVLNGLKNFERIRFGLIPCGTGNDFANAAKIPTDVCKAIDLIIDGEAKFTDFMQLPGLRGINIIGMGIDVEVLERYCNLKHKNKIGYTKCLLGALTHLKFYNFTARFEDGEQRFHSLLANVCNGQMYGGGISICPAAQIADGNLEFIAACDIKKSQVPSLLLKLKGGKILEQPCIRRRSVQSIEILPEFPMVLNVDGELYRDVEFKLNIVKDTLKMYR